MTRAEFLSDMQALLDGEGIRHFRAHELCDVGREKRVTRPRGKVEVVRLEAPPRALWPNIIPTLHVAEWLRERCGKPIDVTSGYRDPAYNAANGGAEAGLHQDFCALDIVVRDWVPLDVALLLLDHPDARLLGIWPYSGWVHVDTRGLLGRVAPARWGTPTNWWLQRRA